MSNSSIANCLISKFRFIITIFAFILVGGALNGCASFSSESLSYRHPEVKARNKIIAAEKLPSHLFIGRRYVIDEACFWGYLRVPNQPWQQSALVAMNELYLKTPDRITEGETVNGKQYGYDHNFEYLIEGSYTGKYIYDSKIGIKALEFKPTKISLLHKSNSWLFHPNEIYDRKKHSLIP